MSIEAPSVSFDYAADEAGRLDVFHEEANSFGAILKSAVFDPSTLPAALGHVNLRRSVEIKLFQLCDVFHTGDVVSRLANCKRMRALAG